MVSSGTKFWTFSGLVVAFINLGVAYILLCASALAYIASKILGLFGLDLPCPCDGVLVDFPVEKIYSVRSAIEYRAPDEINTLKKRKTYRCVELEDDMYPGPYLDSSFRDNVVEEQFDLGTMVSGSLIPRRKIRYRSQFVPVSGKFLRMTPLESDPQIQNGGNAPIRTGFLARDSASDDSYGPVDRTEPGIRERSYGSDDKGIIAMLEEALNEEHAARTALQVELEKERSAAATAADEAMAMILRLQEEKANVEMKARQYQRIVEEKSAYEAEEMNILKEILMRREREKHCLENEVEAYRQMISGKQFPFSDLQDMPSLHTEMSSSYSSENLAQQFNKPVAAEENVKAGNSSYSTAMSIDTETLTSSLDKELFYPETGEDFCSWHKANTDISDRQIEIPEIVGFMKKQKNEAENLLSSECDMEPSFHDVHVINEAGIMHDGASVDYKELSTNCIPKLPMELYKPNPTLRMIKSCSNLTSGPLPADHSQGSTVFSDMNRSFTNTVDYERSRIENEVKWLFNRLRILQESREKLNVSVVRNKNDRGNLNLQVKEAIASSFKKVETSP